MVLSLRWCAAGIIWQFDSEFTNWEIRPSVLKSQPSSSTTQDDDVNFVICGEHFSNSQSKGKIKPLTSHLLIIHLWNLTHSFVSMGGWCNVCNAFSGITESACGRICMWFMQINMLSCSSMCHFMHSIPFLFFSFIFQLIF